ncbi:MAG TPA: SDR family oxidoreductase [Myxococcales bacterium]|jgi:short-subunit dehydrogenase|nr:SDR family oxidoreductase [Myxococcales bacterium]
MDRPVVVTGASRGIGRALAMELAARRHDLVLCARSAELEEVANRARGLGVDVRAVRCDLATAEGREQLVRSVPGAVAGLVNNAGFGTAGEFARQDPAREREMIRLNVEAVVDLSHAFLPRMSRGSFLMNVASTAGFQPVPLFATYSATKAFVLSFSEALTEELAPAGIHVMALCPGVTETDFQRVADVQLAGPRATAEDVARFALRALDAKRRVAIHGTRNALLIHSQRLAPRKAVVKIARRVMEPWLGNRLRRGSG